MERKKMYIAIAAATTLIAGGSYFGYESYKFSKNKDENQIKIEEQSNTKEEENKNSNQNTNNNTNTTNQEIKNYSIVNLNKKDGDFFALPDTIKFSITPNVDQAKLTLKNSSGTVLYYKTVAGSNFEEEIYMSGRVADGSKGTLVVEGLVSGKVVISKEIGVTF